MTTWPGCSEGAEMAARLVADDGDTSSAIVSLLSTMPREDQAELLANPNYG